MPSTRSIQGRARVGGSGFTVFMWAGEPIGFAQQIAHTSPTPVGPGPTPIHPMDSPYPVEIITPAAANIGTLTLRLYELYGEKTWDELKHLSGSVDIVDIFIRVAALDNAVNMVKYVRPPKIGGKQVAPYVEQYHNVVITNVEDGEVIEVGTMEIMKTITVAYTYMTRGEKHSAAWDLGDVPNV